MTDRTKFLVKRVANVHRPRGGDVFLFSTPRSGSTWLMELIASQPGFKFCNEPLNLRSPRIRRFLGTADWRQLYGDAATPLLHRYFASIHQGRLHLLDPSPLSRYYRPFTRRIVFKIIHGGEDRVNWFRETFGGHIVYLLRHPIPVSLSREIYPSLDALLDGDYPRHLTAEQLRYARSIAESGTRLERGVLAWCLENVVPLRDMTDDWVVVSYEQLILDPRPVIERLAERCNLPRPERMLARLAVPSLVKRKSDEETRRALENGGTPRPWFAEKWRKQVSASDERQVMEILERFELDAYRHGDPLPAEWLWIPGGRSASTAIPRPTVRRGM